MAVIIRLFLRSVINCFSLPGITPSLSNSWDAVPVIAALDNRKSQSLPPSPSVEFLELVIVEQELKLPLNDAKFTKRAKSIVRWRIGVPGCSRIKLSLRYLL